ncbi:MAG: sugar ABC transporter permease [Chloroflexi bacterium]|nr:sugar ABC transporter permease [Chloroflexota bacterium]
MASWWFYQQRKAAPYVFIAPFFLLFLAFSLYPVIYAFLLSFQKQTGLSTPQWVGLKNYRNLLEDPRFLKSIWNTTYFALGSVLIQLPIAFALALAFDSRFARRFTQLYRVAFFFPVLTSAVVVSLIWVLVLNKDYGMLNTALEMIGLPRIPWLQSTRWAMPAIILLGVWTWSGFNAFYFLAGLQGIPNELKEAAMIDGANRWQVLTRVTIPLLRPVIMFVVIQSIIGSYNLFAQPFLLTGGGPSDATLTVTMYLYYTGFQYFKLGYASAIGYSLVVIVFILSAVNLYFFGAFRED